MLEMGVRERVGSLCEQLSRWPSLEGIVRGAGAGGELDALLAALGGGGEPDPEQVARWVEAIGSACARKGLVAVTTRGHPFRPLPAGLRDTPAVRAWVCPRDRCDRVVLPEEAEAAPVCAIAGMAPMTVFTLPPP